MTQQPTLSPDSAPAFDAYLSARIRAMRGKITTFLIANAAVAFAVIWRVATFNPEDAAKTVAREQVPLVVRQEIQKAIDDQRAREHIFLRRG